MKRDTNKMFNAELEEKLTVAIIGKVMDLEGLDSIKEVKDWIYKELAGYQDYEFNYGNHLFLKMDFWDELIRDVNNRYVKKHSKIINLTPHDVNIVTTDGENVTTFPSEGVVRVSTKSSQIKTIAGIPVYSTTYGAVEGLPEVQVGIYYIVSMLVKQAEPDRKDLLSPSQLQRDDKGRIIGCLGLE